MLTYAATIPLSTRTLGYLTGLLAAHRDAIGSTRRRLSPGEQTLLVLAHLRNGDTYARLAAGFDIGIATAWRYVQRPFPSPAVMLSARLNRYYGRLRLPPGQPSTSRDHRL